MGLDEAEAFFERIRERLEKGGVEYAGKSFSKPIRELLSEVEEEIVDIAAWSFIGWTRIRNILRRLEEEDKSRFL